METAPRLSGSGRAAAKSGEQTGHGRLAALVSLVTVHSEYAYLVETTDETPEVLVADALGDVIFGHVNNTVNNPSTRSWNEGRAGP